MKKKEGKKFNSHLKSIFQSQIWKKKIQWRKFLIRNRVRSEKKTLKLGEENLKASEIYSLVKSAKNTIY